MNATQTTNAKEQVNAVDEEVARFARRILSPFPAPDVRLAELFNSESGRLDAKHVAAFFGLSLSTLASLLGVSSQEVHEAPDAPSLQRGLAPFHFVALALKSLVEEPEGARVWLQTSNEDFDGDAPLALIQNGEVELSPGCCVMLWSDNRLESFFSLKR